MKKYSIARQFNITLRNSSAHCYVQLIVLAIVKQKWMKSLKLCQKIYQWALDIHFYIVVFKLSSHCKYIAGSLPPVSKTLPKMRISLFSFWLDFHILWLHGLQFLSTDLLFEVIPIIDVSYVFSPLWLSWITVLPPDRIAHHQCSLCKLLAYPSFYTRS